MNIRSINQPVNRPLTENMYVLEEEYSLFFERLRIARKILLCVKFTIPRGFVNDGASAPQLAWSVTGIRPDGIFRAGALIHDALYMHGGCLPAYMLSCALLRTEIHTPIGTYVYDEVPDGPVRFTRYQCDLLLDLLLKQSGVSRTKRLITFAAVRIFGKKHWSRS